MIFLSMKILRIISAFLVTYLTGFFFSSSSSSLSSRSPLASSSSSLWKYKIIKYLDTKDKSFTNNKTVVQHDVTPSSTKTATTTKPVTILVCTEALCPDCQEFVLNEIKHAIQIFGNKENNNDKSQAYHDIFDLQIVPFGNAKITQATQQKEVEELVCQHGQRECDANSWEQCAVHVYPQLEQHLPFVECLYRTLPMGGHHDDVLDPTLFEGCAIQSQLNYELLKTCRQDIGWELQKKAASATPTYHDHVPWVELNHVHFDETSQDFVQEICKVYVANGGSHPVCQEQ